MLFLFRKLYNRYLLIVDKIDKKRKVAALQRKHKITGDFQFCWDVNRVEAVAYSGPADNGSYTIFGTPVSLDSIDWHKDYVSGFVYPVKRFNEINIAQWFDKGIDIKFPWEVSRFYFAPLLGQRFIQTGDEKYYRQFKQLVYDWLEKNPFLYGVNWYCAMEVGIRAVNWVVAANFFRDKIVIDHEFRKILTDSLVQHGFYISAFPEIKKNGLSNNHLIADYTGLLFISLSLSDSPETIQWRKQAVDGLLHCMDTQVNDDGTDFEGSIPYHRLVLEFFGYAALLCRLKDIELPEWFYVKLFRMFEFTAAYMDHNGNAPQIGDNDSGRLLVLHSSKEHDHSYLLDLGECLIDYRFPSQCMKRNIPLRQWFPPVHQIKISQIIT